MDLLFRFVGHQKTQDIVNSVCGYKNGLDRLVWLPKEDGVFSSSEAWECIRVRAPKIKWDKWIWHTCIPKKMTIILWKCFNNVLSVDDRLRRVGIPIESKCDCCTKGAYEDLKQVFVAGEVAKSIWRRCASHVGLSSFDFRSWVGMVSAWYHRATKRPVCGLLFGIIPAIVTWVLWTRRCTARMEGRTESVEVLWNKVKFWIAKISEKACDLQVLSGQDVQLLREFNFNSRPTRKKCMVPVYWIRPKQGWVKLSTDGSSKGNPRQSGAEGVLRDQNGNLIIAFSTPLAYGTNNYAEFMGLLLGVRTFCLLGLNYVEIELDSKVVVNWLLLYKCPVWYLEDYWDELIGLLRGKCYTVSHIFRQGNDRQIIWLDLRRMMVLYRIHRVLWNRFLIS